MDAPERDSARQAAELRLMRMRLERLKRDVARATATPLELRIARSVQDARRAAAKAATGARRGRVLKAKQKPKRQETPKQLSGSLFGSEAGRKKAPLKGQDQAWESVRSKRPAWGSGGGQARRVEGSTPVYWRRRQAFPRAEDVPLEFDPIVIADKKSYGKNTAIPGGLEERENWHVVEGCGAKEILIKQSDKRLGKAYEYLKQEEEDAGKGGYPGLLTSARIAEDDDEEGNGGEVESNRDADGTSEADNLLTQLRVQDLIDDIYEKKQLSDDYHRANDDLCLSLDEFAESYFRVEFGTAGALNSRRFAAFKQGVLCYYHESMQIMDFADAIGWKSEAPDKENTRSVSSSGAGSGPASVTGSNAKKKLRKSAGGVVVPIPPHRLDNSTLLKSEAQKWLSRGRQLLDAQLKMCEREIESITKEMEEGESVESNL
eukprot:g5180.t1